MSTEIPPALQAVQKTARKPRKGCEYTVEERLILAQYKEIYRAKTTAGERRSLIQTQILVAIFNYWDSKRIVPDAQETQDRIKTLGTWIANNWRPYKTVKEGQTVRKRSKLDVVWQEMRQACQDEITAMGGDVFGSRTTAAKRIYEGLSPDERRKIDTMAERSADSVNPPEVQRKRADRLGASTVKTWANHQWRDMGMLALTFFAYTGKDGKVVVRVEDRMAANAGKSERRFIDLYAGLVENVQLKVFDYAKLLISGGMTPDPAYPVQNRQALIDLDTEDGYPLMPDLGEMTSMKKEDLRDLLRRYLTEQYKLASGFRKNHVPFGQLIGHTSQFVNPKYLPQTIAFKDPHNMTKEAIVQLCTHIRERQETHGVRDAFIFRQYADKGKMIPAEYTSRADQVIAAARAAKQKASRKTKATRKARTHQVDGRTRKATAQQFTGQTQEATAQRENEPSRHTSHDIEQLNLAQGNEPTRHPFNDTEHPGQHPHTSHDTEQSGLAQAHDPSRHQLNDNLNNNEHPAQHPFRWQDDSMIDPALRSIESSGARQSETIPASMPTDDTIVIGFTEMELLKSHGYPSAIPFNSPNEGSPLYQVPAAAGVLLRTAETIPVAARERIGQSTTTPEQRTLEKPPERATEPSSSRTVFTGRLTRSRHQRETNIGQTVPTGHVTRSRTLNVDGRTVQEAQVLLKRKRSRKRGN